MLNIREQPALLFWIGLVGIVVTGSIVGMGADNYWGLANIGNLDPTVPAVRGQLLMAALAALTGLCDLGRDRRGVRGGCHRVSTAARCGLASRSCPGWRRRLCGDRPARPRANLAEIEPRATSPTLRI